MTAMYQEALTLPSLSLLPAFYEILCDPSWSTPSLRRKYFRETGLLSAPAIITQWNALAPSPRARINVLPVIIPFIHLTLCSWFCFFLSRFLSLSLFSLFICEEMFLHLFCVIEEGDADEPVQPWVRERIQSQLVCRSPVMSKRDKMKVCSVCHVPQPWEALLRKDNL